MFEYRVSLRTPPPLLPQRWVLFEYSSFDQFPNNAYNIYLVLLLGSTCM